MSKTCLRPARTHRATAVVAAFASLLLLGGTANADDAYRELKRINNDINSARRSFPSNIGARLDYEGRVIKNIKKRLQGHRARLTPNLKIQKAAYKSVKDNLDDAEAYVVVLQKVHAAATQIAAIRTAHRAGRAVSKAKLKALDDAVARLRATNSKNWQEAIKNWTKTAKEFRAANPKVAAKATAQANEKDRGDRRVKASRALSALDRTMRSNEELTAEALKTLSDAIKTLEGKDAASATYFKAELARYRAQAAWDQNGDGAPEKIATLLGGTLVGNGMTKGKKMKLKFDVQADRCYALFMRYARWSGAEKVDDIEVTEKSKRPLQEFSVQQNQRWKTPRTRGFCTITKAKVAITAALKFAGTKNGVRYALVEWTRDSFPLAIAGRLQLDDGDHCDFQHWYDLWDKPVPGTFAYSGKQPVLIAGPGYRVPNNGYIPARAYWIGFSDGNIGRAKGITSTPPKAVAITAKNRFKRCLGYNGSVSRKAAPRTKKIKRCHDSIERKYASQWRAINRIREAAAAQNAVSPSAERRAERLGDREERETARKCGPLEKKAVKEAAKTYDKLADLLADKMYKPRFDRGDYLRQILD